MALISSAENENGRKLQRFRMTNNDEFEREPKAPLDMNIDPVDITQTEDLFRKGTLLHYVQVQKVLKDGKEFVDRPAKVSPFTIVQRWNNLLSNTVGYPTTDTLLSFIEENFDEAGGELEPVNLEEFSILPTYLSNIQHEGLVRLGTEIQEVWMELGKQVKKEVLEHPNRTSMIYLPKPFVIPGGRFKEIYYWDTYWVVRSLLRTGAVNTSRDILQNYFYMIEHYGMIPNGNRNYYLDRSQPPLLIHMVKDYVQFTRDYSILKNVDLLIKEMFWFEKNRMIKVTTESGSYAMFRYSTNGSGPRPESYLEDLEAVEDGDFQTEAEEECLLKHIQAGAESGWDFSSRWLIDAEGGCTGSMENTRTRFIVPVDLNAIMYKNYASLADFLSFLGRSEESMGIKNKADRLRSAVKEVLFDPKTKTWRDYDLVNKKQRDFYFASNICPLWTRCYAEEEAEELGDAAADYLINVNAVRPGGLITTNIESGLQWDAPNCWPPLQEMAVTGLMRTGSEKARKVSKEIASNFTNSVLESCGEDVCELYEKYNAEEAGTAGGGGEYEVQKGFGWTNGVIVEFISVYQDQLLDEITMEQIQKTEKCAPGWLQLKAKQSVQCQKKTSADQS